MSWGYFADLQLSLDTKAWEKLCAQKPADVVLEAGWSGFDDDGLEKAFSRPFGARDTFARLLATPAFNGRETVNRAVTRGATTSVRICIMLDKSSLELAYPLATLFEAARASPAQGKFRLVNDGTYVGENGVALTLSGGKIIKETITDTEELVTSLAGELFSATMEASSKPGTSRRGGINPFTGKPIEAADLGPKKKTKSRTTAKKAKKRAR
jgi:hypothetical protein